MKKALLIVFIVLASTAAFKVLAQPLSGYIISQQNIACDTSVLGNVMVSGFGGTAPYWFELDASGVFLPGDIDYNGDLILDRAFPDLSIGPHNIVVKDAADDVFDIPVNIEVNVFNIGIINVTDIECSGNDDGQINAGVTGGGTIPVQWSIDDGINWQGTGLFLNLTSGPYTVTALDDFGCISTYDTIVEVGDQSHIIVLANNDVICFGQANGSVEVGTVNGASPYSYSMDLLNWQPAGVFPGLAAGSYIFYSKGSNDCIVDTVVEINQPDELLIENLTLSNNPCFGDTLGSVTFNVGGGIPGYSYILNGNPILLPIDGLGAGFYTLIVTDTNACTVSEDFTISEPNQIVITVDNKTDVTCFSGDDGTILVSAIGGTGNIQFGIDGGPLQAGGLFSGLNAGNHTILAEDENGCQETLVAQIAQPSQITATPLIDHPDCENAANGSIDFINPGGGNGGPYTYTYSDDGGVVFQPFVPPLINRIPGNYIIRIYDVNGVCFNTYNIDLIADSDLNIDSFDIIDAICGISAGTVTVNASGGLAPYTYKLNGIGSIPAGNPVFPNVSPGSYPVSVTDILGCSFSSTVDVNEVTDIVITYVGGNNEYCGNIDGEIEITVTGGTADYLFNITGDPLTYGPDPNGWNFGGLAAGNYTITVTDAQGCVQTIEIIITNEEPADLDIIFSDIVKDFCENDSGAITVTGVGGDPDYLFELIPPGGVIIGPVASTTFTDLAWGDYDIILTDINGCSITLPFEIENNPVDTSLHFIFIDTTSASCLLNNDGEIIVDGTGGSGEYEFAIDGLPNVPVTSGVFSNLLPDVYTITILDTTTTCTLDTNIIVDNLSSLKLDLVVKDSVCVAGDTIGTFTVLATGGTAPYNYSIIPAVGFEVNGTFTGIPAGTYDVTASDMSGCTQNLEVVMEVRPPFPFVFDTDSVLCHGADDGKITVWASTGQTDPPSPTAPYTFEISSNPGVSEGPANSWTFSMLQSSLYSILLTDDKGCEQTITDIEIEEPDTMGFLAFPDDTIQLKCFGEVTQDSALTPYDFIFVSGTGGLPGYEYSVNAGPFVPGNTGSDWHQLIGYPAGSIDVDIKDNNGCIYSTEVVVEEPQFPLEAAFNITGNPCIGDSIGVIEVIASGGWGNYQYQIDGVTLWQLSNIFGGLAPGSYTVNISDNLNNDAINDKDCQVSYVVDIVITDPLEADLSINNHPNCDLAANGSVELEILQGWGASPINLLIDGNPAPDIPINSNPYTIIDLTDGIHEFILDNGVCQVILTDTLTYIDDLQLTLIDETPIECPLDSNGMIEFSVSGGVPPYIFEIDGIPIAGPPTATNLPFGNHIIMVTDSVGCTFSLDATVSTLSTLVGSTSAVDALCDDGFSTGSVTVSATGAPSPFQFWEQSDPGNVFLGTEHEFLDLLVGNYNFWVRDTTGCEIVLPVTINEFSGVAIDLNVVQDPICHGDSNAIVSITVLTGVQPYQYSLNDTLYFPFPASSIVTSILLTEGNHSIFVEAENGCKAVDSVFIAERDSLFATINYLDSITCFGDATAAIEINPSGGIMGYQFSFDQSGFGPDSVFTNIGAGSYLYEVVDANGCSFIDTLLFGQPDSLYFDSVLVSAVKCFGGNDSTGIINVVGIGGTLPYTYSLDGGPPLASGLFENLTTGEYLLSITDFYGCSTDSLVVVSEPDSLFLSALNFTDILCFGDSSGTVEMIASGGTPGYVYQLTGVDTNLTGIFAGLPVRDYFINVVDLNGCEFKDTITLTQPPEIILAVVNIQDLICYNDSSGQVEINATGGVAPYLFGQNIDDLTPSGLITDLNADTTWFYTRDANLCLDSIWVEVNQPDSLWLTVDITQQIDCFNAATGQFEISGIGGTAGYLYAVNGSAFDTDSIVSNAAAGAYIILIQDSHQCEFADTLILSEPDFITFNAVVTPVDCYNNQNGSIEILAAGGTPDYLYSLDSLNWFTVGIFGGFATGNQAIYIIDNNNCVVDSVVYVSQPDSITSIYNEINPVTCAGFSNAAVQFDVSGGTAPYIGVLENDTLSGPVFILDNLGKGEYVFSIFDGNNCLKENVFSLNEPDSLEAEIDPVELVCYGDQNGVGTVNVSGGTGSYFYRWNNSTGDETPITQANLIADISYMVTVYDAIDSACFISSEVIPTQPPQITFILTPLSFSCDIDDRGILIEVTNGGVEPLKYWTGLIVDTSDAVSDPYFSDLNGEITSFFVIDSTGCIENDFLTPFNPNIPNAGFVVDNSNLSFLDPLLNLTDQSDNHIIVTWDFGDGVVLSGGIDESFNELYTWGPVVSPTHEYQLPGDYEIKMIVTSAFGCMDSSFMAIYIQAEDLIYIPNAFTPDGDGDNDIFNVEGIALQSEGFLMQIFERRGRLVYRTVDINRGWDGNDLKGSKSPATVYTYVIRVFSGDRLIEKSGSVLLIR